MILAWAHATSPQETIDLLAPFGIGAVLHHSNYEAALLAPESGPWVVRLESLAAIDKVKSLVDQGAKIHAGIFKDERNMTGLSGAYMTPEDYSRQYLEAKERVDGYFPLSTMGIAWLSPQGSGIIPQSLRFTQFDYDYYSKIPEAPISATNPGWTPMSRVENFLDNTEGKWILSPHPYNPQWFPIKYNTIGAWLIEQVVTRLTVENWVRVSKREDVEAVAIWGLKAHYVRKDGPVQSWHNMYDMDNNLTYVGRHLKKALEK